MHRCIALARLGAGTVAPNPMVGAVLVYNERIIGEGYHMQYGQAHAEVNCINSVDPADQEMVARSTMYVSLEPCAHYGKTPPCADLIIAKKIPRVVIGCRDPFKEVNGKGIEKLLAAGIEVIQPVLGDLCRKLNKRFFIFHQQHRPYIILKWAQTANGFMGSPDSSRLLISNAFSNQLVHKWRSEEAGILVGTNTALRDNPLLSTRHWQGADPVRLVVDMHLRLPHHLHVFDGTVRTIIFNGLRQEAQPNLQFYQLKKDTGLVAQLCQAIYQLNIQSVVVEGGAKLLQSFIAEKMFDEGRVITNNDLQITNGVPAPSTADMLLQNSIQLQSDSVHFYHPAQ